MTEEKNEMDNGQKFWIRMAIILATVITLCVLSFVSCNVYKYHKVDVMTRDGISPIEARCALGSESIGLCEMFLVKQAGER